MLPFSNLFYWSTIILLSFSSLSRAQDQSYDVVYYASGESVHCELIGVTENTVRYRLSDLPDGEVYNELRDDIVLVFKRNGEFLLPAESGIVWKAGSNPNYDHIVTDDSRVLPAVDIQENEDIIYYQDPAESTDASIRTDETTVIIYQDGGHKLMNDVNEVVAALEGAIDFAPSVDSVGDAVASTESMAADPPGEPTPTEEDAEVPEPAEDPAAVAEVAEDFEDDTATAEETSDVEPDVSGPAEEIEFSDMDYEEFAAKAMNKAEYLSHYLALLCNQDLDTYDKDQAIDNALKLFLHDSTLVQVSSLTQEDITTYKINGYLKHLSLLNYEKVELLWRNVQYITKFRLAPDGNYYGTITVEQVFQGFQDGQPIYEDITQKDIEIVLGNFKREESGTTEYVWDVLLSDIGVEETRRK